MLCFSFPVQDVSFMYSMIFEPLVSVLYLEMKELFAST
jgi:hypothetical protein